MSIHCRARLCTAALATLSALCACGAVAQTFRLQCMTTGPGGSEPLGDRDGHALAVSSGACRVEGGPLDGGVVTQQNIWEVDKGVFTSLSADSVTRVPGGWAVFRGGAGTLTVRMQDGRPAGWTGSGRGQYTLAVGRAAPRAAKAVSWTGQATGARTYVLDVTVE